MGSMASAAANDISIGLGFKDDPGPTPRDDMAGRKSSYQRRTAATIARNKANEEYYRNDDKPAPPRAELLVRRAAATSIAPVEAAPTIPDPDAIGETEQALLDAQKKGRSSTIQTSAKGLLSGEDSTRKKRSLMGGLIS